MTAARLLYLTDRLSVRGGADQHLLAVVRAAVERGAPVTVACGRVEPEVDLPRDARTVRLRGLASRTASPAGLNGLGELLAAAEVVHVQNVMNPVPLSAAARTGRAVVTLQDHRLFCPGPGRTLPDGCRCTLQMADAACAACLPTPGYRREMLALTAARRDALRGSRPIVLSRYMAREVTEAGLGEALVLPPWIEPGPPRNSPGAGFLLGGRLVAHKDPLTAWRGWRRSVCGHPLRVAGEGPLVRDLVDAEHLGWLGSGGLRAELRSSRALLFPARWQEPFGILPVEALAEGTPVVAADVGGTREWSDAGCLVVPSGDARAFADAIARLAADEQLALRLGREGRAMVADRFSRMRLEPRLWQLYEDVTRR